ncbi:MAG: hypothetical protein M3378_01520 [Actinomycetota bacterium]|nr:hypothetical protein [Actinomycetota bacterium]
MRDARGQLEGLGATAVAVGFSPADALAALADELEWPWPFLSDTDRVLYGRLGLGRASRRDVFNPATLRRYREAAARGVPMRMPVEDVRQLGGDAIVRGGRALRVFRPVSPDDRAPVPVLMEALAEEAEGDG